MPHLMVCYMTLWDANHCNHRGNHSVSSPHSIIYHVTFQQLANYVNLVDGERDCMHNSIIILSSKQQDANPVRVAMHVAT